MSHQHEGLQSLLDNDLYKLTMQYAVLQHYKDAQVVYQFTNREKELHLNAEAVEWLEQKIHEMANLQLTKDEAKYIQSLPFFDDSYVKYLSEFRYQPSKNVTIQFDKDTEDLQIQVRGAWHETILYEVPLLALISEAYFRYVDRDWNYDGQVDQASGKARALLEAGCAVSEFGTRRRRDFKTHDMVFGAIYNTYQQYKSDCEKAKQQPKGVVSGTSNVYLAMKYGVTPIGTVAHEFFMAVSALEGVQGANRKTLEKWTQTYHGALGIALTDTFTTDVFLRDFRGELAKTYAGVRQDSGDPMTFIPLMVNHYKSLGIDPSTKTIVFSDALTVEKAIHLLHSCEEYGIKASFGIGTYFTNDFHKASDPSVKSKPLNIVIKMHECKGQRVIKLSDDALKHSADMATVNKFKKELGI
ncbi:nicotinate phosphoribosyltransferase [Radiomyces spectabilis]|uniref:nicotinate phosphoribosyltransferase n=1 Tax=Radiomyces spectabilis TaxID=64574 RepID=UPI0022200180|nr:nicotinate phosphoribosyltransferase [Radiomyces spectabilis]KAI8377789.1 nicotinate phosphoribosyltransferase [Radiomyces spectabilis]